MAKTKPIRDSLTAVFFPHVLSLGFELDKRWQPLFMVFRRFSTNAVHVFEIQWDKYHRPKFVINFSEAPLGGVEFGEKWMDSKDIAPVHCGTYLHLMRSRGRFTYKWFQLRRPLIEQLVLLSILAKLCLSAITFIRLRVHCPISIGMILARKESGNSKKKMNNQLLKWDWAYRATFGNGIEKI
jgi:hypothetical protein